MSRQRGVHFYTIHRLIQTTAPPFQLQTLTVTAVSVRRNNLFSNLTMARVIVYVCLLLAWATLVFAQCADNSNGAFLCEYVYV